jgi:hypothetical protein
MREVSKKYIYISLKKKVDYTYKMRVRFEHIGLFAGLDVPDSGGVVGRGANQTFAGLIVLQGPNSFLMSLNGALNSVFGRIPQFDRVVVRACSEFFVRLRIGANCIN